MVLLVGVLAEVRADPKQDRRLSRLSCLKDARELVRLLEASHPDPFSPFGGKVSFKRRAKALFGSLPARGMTVAALGEVLQQL